MQQAPPPVQQSSVPDVAVALPMNATEARINRIYFISWFLVGVSLSLTQKGEPPR